MSAILYMVGTLLLVNGILFLNRDMSAGIALVFLGCVMFLLNLLRLLRQRGSSRGSSQRHDPGDIERRH